MTNLDRAAEGLSRLSAYTSAIDINGRDMRSRMFLEMEGHPKAGSWDTSTAANKVHCWDHGQDLRACHAAGMDCMGEEVSGHSDPTGEAAMRADRASDDLHHFDRKAKQLGQLIEELTDIASRYQPPRPASLFERGQTANPNDPRCESCGRIEITKGVPWFREPLTKERTTVGDRLAKPMWLDRFCYDHVVSRGCIPTEAELEQNRDGKRIRCPHPELKNEDVA